MRPIAVGLAGLLLVVGCTGGGDDRAAFCEQIAALTSLDERFATIDLSDRDAVVDALTSYRAQFADLAEVSPDAIDDDVDAVARYGQALADAAIGADPDDPFDQAGALAAAAASEPGIEDALERVAAYTARSCTPPPG